MSQVQRNAGFNISNVPRSFATKWLKMNEASFRSCVVMWITRLLGKMNWKWWSISDKWKALPGWMEFDLQTVTFRNEVVCFLNSKETGITSWAQ